jgi:adenosylcobinamide-phosphate synthase
VTDRLILFVIVLVVVAVLAWLPGAGRALAAPLEAAADVVSWFDRRLNRADRSAANRAARGLLVLVIVVGIAAVLGAVVARGGTLIEAIALATLIDAHGFRAARRTARKLDAAREEHHALARGAIERLTNGFAIGIVGAAFWYLLLGLPGLAAIRAVDVVADRIGGLSPRYAAFGRIARGLELLLQMIPAPLAGMLISLAAVFAPRARPLRAARTMLRDASPARGGWAWSAVAGALDLSLGGPRQYPDAIVSGPWIGDGRARATARDVAAAIYLIGVATLLTAGILGALALSRLG